MHLHFAGFYCEGSSNVNSISLSFTFYEGQGQGSLLTTIRNTINNAECGVIKSISLSFTLQILL